MRLINVPNTLTVLRMLLVPGLVWFLMAGAYEAALWVFVVAGVSDGLDGFIARKFNQCTRLGSMLDPLADKLLLVSSVVVLAWLGLLPGWLALLIVVRDLMIVGGAVAFHLRAGQLEMDPSLLSKLNTFVQLCLIFAVLAHAAGMLRLGGILSILVALAGLTTFLSGAHYAVVWARRWGGRALIGLLMAAAFCGIVAGCGREGAQKSGEGAPPSGEALFQQHCSGCHPNGGNVLYPQKSLHRMVLAANGIDTPRDVVARMRKPGPRMRQFNRKALSDREAYAIAEYVLRTFR